MFNFKDIALKAIHDIGGCDAADEYARGYDDGVNAAYAAVQSLASEDQRIEAIARHYGTAQKMIMLEEMLELGMAIMKLERGFSQERFNNLKEEIADVLIMACQLRLLFGSRDVDKIIEEKIERQLGRIQAENDWANEQLPNINIIETPEITQRLTKEFWERKANEPPTDKCIIEEDWAEFGKLVQEGK